MRVFVYTLGCKLNQCESEAIADAFTHEGFSLVTSKEIADIYIVNTCTVTTKAEQKARRMIRKFLHDNREAVVITTGCYAQMEEDLLRELIDRVVIVSLEDKPKLLTLASRIGSRAIADSDIYETIYSIMHEESPHTSFDYDAASFSLHSRAFLKIQDGCDYHCSFCTIPLARGHSRSMPYEQIEKEMQGLIDDGYREVVLSGINLGDYKTDDGKKFVDALKLIDEKSGDMRVRISSIEPNLLSEEVLEVVANSKNIVPHFHIPLQSGSQELLRKMKRRYKATYYHDLVLRIKEVMPHCCIGVDVILGFPGETDELAKETYDFLNG